MAEIEDDSIVVDVRKVPGPAMYAMVSVAVDKRYGVHTRSHYVVVGAPWGQQPFCMSDYTFHCAHTEKVKEAINPTGAEATIDLSEEDEDPDE